MAAEDWISGEEWEEDEDDGADTWWFKQGYRSVTCKHCGKTGLHWEETDTGWTLVGKNYEVHDCRHPQATLDDFDALD